MSNLQRLKERALQNPDVKAEYDKLEDEFAIINQLLNMRQQAGLTQEELAAKMGTAKSNISRMEKGKNSPKLATLQNYAKACGFAITIGFEPTQKVG